MSEERKTKVPAVTSERRDEYVKEEKSYFGPLYDESKKSGMCATDKLIVDRHLPSKKEEHQLLDKWERGLSKATRSGAFSKAGAGPAIFPNGMKSAMDFIDENTPGKYKKQEEMKPLKEQTREVDTPKAAAVLDNICIDCMMPVNIDADGKLACWMRIMTSGDIAKLTCMGLKFGDIVLGVEHQSCLDKASTMGKNATRLVLVFGSLTDETDVRIAQKYGFHYNLHDGSEKTLGQWELHKRQDRIDRQLEDYLIQLDKTSPVYARNR